MPSPEGAAWASRLPRLAPRPRFLSRASPPKSISSTSALSLALRLRRLELSKGAARVSPWGARARQLRDVSPPRAPTAATLPQPLEGTLRRTLLALLTRAGLDLAVWFLLAA